MSNVDTHSDDNFALLCDAVDVTTQELFDEAMTLLNGQVKSAHAVFDAIAEGSYRPQRTKTRKRRRQMGHTAT